MLAGKSYQSRDLAENYVRTIEGRARHTAQLIPQYDHAIEAWQGYAKTLEAENARLKSGRPAAQPQPGAASTQPTDPADIRSQLDGLQWEEYERILNDQGPQFAGYWLAEQTAQLVDKRVEAALSKRDQRYQPLLQSDAAAQAGEKATSLFNGVASQLQSDGATPIYPELVSPNPEVAREIVQIWVETAKRIGAKAAMSEIEVHRAVLEYRHRHPSAPAAAGASQPVLDRMRAEADASASVVSGSGVPRPAAGVPGNDMVRRIAEAGTSRLPGFPGIRG